MSQTLTSNERFIFRIADLLDGQFEEPPKPVPEGIEDSAKLVITEALSRPNHPTLKAVQSVAGRSIRFHQLWEEALATPSRARY